ncbi:Uncharacterised protein r2_g4288 [Pycnogonum litorale]
MCSDRQVSSRYCPANFVDWEDMSGALHGGDWRQVSCDQDPSCSAGITPIGRVGANTSSRFAQTIRNQFANYFCNVGVVSWQDRSAYRGQNHLTRTNSTQ